jgi:FkbM family methyltransferase
MKIHYNSRNVLFRELEGDEYGIKNIPQNFIGYMIDIGAAYGLLSIMARLLHPKMRITAIEPHPGTYKDLLLNVDRMKIKTFNFALGNGGMFYLEKERKMRLCNSFGEKKVKDTTAIQSYTLAGLVKLCKADASDLALKIDCEGAEWCMIDNKEDEKIIKQCKLMAVEVHNKNGKQEVEEFYDWIDGLVGGTHAVIIKRQTDKLGIIKIKNCELY